MIGIVAGFTGTQQGMTSGQIAYLAQMLEKHNVIKIHLGDCIGADVQAYWEARALGIITVGHPPTNRVKRALLKYDEVREAAPYLTRNRHIVIESSLLFVAPLTNDEQLRSGTWSTFRYAVKTNVDVCMVER